MAIQQVNLYLPELRPSKEWLTLSTLAICLTGMLLIFLVSSVASHFAVSNLEEQVESVESQLINAQVQVKSIRGKLQPLKTNNLQLQVAYLKAAIQGREQVGKIIAGQNLGNADGFSDYLQALAELSSGEFSLEKIRLSDGGQFLELKGQTRSPAAIAEYLQHLYDSPAFSATQFGLLSVANNEAPRGIHYFSVGFESIYEQLSSGARQ